VHRLLVPTDALAEERPALPREAARHLKVLRPRAGEEIELFDGRGGARTYRWDAAAGALGDPAPVAPSAPRPFPLTLFACVTKGSRWDWTVEKAVELGASRIVPVLSARCVVRIPPAERAAKAERWRRVAEDAARQCDARWLPDVLPAEDFDAALARLGSCARVFVGALVKPPAPPLLTALAAEDAAAAAARGGWGIFTGPEGDFTPEELAALVARAVPVSFGPTVLRAETAAIFGLAALAAAADAFRERTTTCS